MNRKQMFIKPAIFLVLCFAFDVSIHLAYVMTRSKAMDYDDDPNK